MADPTGQGFGPGGLPLGAAVPTAQPVDASGTIISVKSADGAMVTEGNTSDAAVTGDTAGTNSAKLRGLLKIFTSVWDSVNNAFQVTLKSKVITTAADSTGVPWGSVPLGGATKSLAVTLYDTSANPAPPAVGESDTLDNGGAPNFRFFAKPFIWDGIQWVRARNPYQIQGQDSTTLQGRGVLAVGTMGKNYADGKQYQAQIDSTGTVKVDASGAALPTNLTTRMLAKNPQTGWSLWMDTGDINFLYILEALSTKVATDTGFQGIRMTKSATGSLVGKVQTNIGATLTFNNRTTDGNWS